ncbi:MAG TPA: Ig-like domain-containing protein [Candidatus Paceibacterota bacterium]|nr:Ig-like domain-containing protein [Candidatus Paceibacterota bacterium]
MHITNKTTATLIALSLFALAPLGALAAHPEADIDTEALTTSSTKPTLTGTASATPYVRIRIESEKGKSVFTKSIRVDKDKEWKAKVSKKLAKGEYEVTVRAGKTSKGDLLAEGVLAVGTTSSSPDSGASSAGKGTTLSVSSVPLLFGGSARVLSSVPVAYVKVMNASDKESAIDGITLVQNGSAPVSVVSSFSTSDDKGGSRATHAVTASSFDKDRTVFVPLAATIPAGQFRIFTIKAWLGIDSLYKVGTQLKLDVASIGTGAKVVGTLPMAGTTWTLSY